MSMGRKHGRRSYVRMGRSAQSLRPPHPASDPGRVTQGDAVRDGHGGDPSRHPGQHLATPDGPAKRKARGLRPGRGAALLLPEPSEAGGRDPRAACRGPAGHPQDEGADRPGEGAGEEGTGGFPWMKGSAPLSWTTIPASPRASFPAICWKRHRVRPWEPPSENRSSAWPMSRTPWRRAGAIPKKAGSPVWRSLRRFAQRLSKPRWNMRRRRKSRERRGIYPNRLLSRRVPGDGRLGIRVRPPAPERLKGPALARQPGDPSPRYADRTAVVCVPSSGDRRKNPGTRVGPAERIPSSLLDESGLWGHSPR